MQTKTIKKWRLRWLAGEAQLQAIIEQQSEAKDFGKILTEQVLLSLSDARRSGAPPTSTPEQYCQLLEVALEKPTESGREINRWSHRELAEEVNQRGIFPQISTTQVGRFLKRSRPQTTSD